MCPFFNPLRAFGLFIFEFFVNRMDGNAGTGFGMPFVGRPASWPYDQMVGFCHRQDEKKNQGVQRSLRPSLFRQGGIRRHWTFPVCSLRPALP
jgi:hypothetical protein